MSQEQTFVTDDLVPCSVYEGSRIRFRESRVLSALSDTVEGRRQERSTAFHALAEI